MKLLLKPDDLLGQIVANQLLAMLPNHDRTSCSDKHPPGLVNGYRPHEDSGRDGTPRCKRCALMRYKWGAEPHSLLIELSVDLRWVDTE